MSLEIDIKEKGFTFLRRCDTEPTKIHVKCNKCGKEYLRNKYALLKKKHKHCNICVVRSFHSPEKKVGEVYKGLEIVKYLGSDGYFKSVYTFKCICGKLFDARLNNVQYGKTSSCGCKKSEYIKRNYRKPIEDIAVNRIFQGMTDKRRKVSNSLSKSQVKDLIFKPCHYCGTEESNTTISKNGNRSIKHNGIDRVDSSKGYEAGNVVTCCKVCNVMKSTLSVDEFKEHIIKLYNKFTNKDVK